MTELDSLVSQMCLKHLPDLFDELNEALPAEDRRGGGWFCIREERDQAPLVIVRVGGQPLEKSNASMRRCQEKAASLQSRSGDVSSYQSRNESQDQWGGAIRWDQYILSFSGLPEKADEVLMIMLAQMEEWADAGIKRLSHLQAAEILRASENPYMMPTDDIPD